MRQSHSLMTSSSIIERWKQCVIAGNQSLLKEEFDVAARQYEFARQSAETIFEKWVNPCEAASALVVTYHNIADLHRKLGNASTILFYLERAHTIVLRALVATPVGDEKHHALMGASKRTYSALVNYKKCGIYN